MDEKNVLNILPNRILSFYNEAKELLKGEMINPRMAILHANYTCNHKCIGCDYADINNEEKITMTRENAKRLVDELLNMKIQAVEFAGGGEPTLDPNISFLIDEFAKHKIAMGLITNGSMLKGELLMKVILNFNYVRISLEAGSPEVFQKVKGINNPNEFDQIVENIKNAITLREMYKKRLNINIKFTVGNDNFFDMEKGIEKAIEIGVDSIQFGLYENVNSRLSNYPAISINYILQSLQRKYSDKIRVLGSLLPSKIEGNCWLNPIFTVIDALGDVYICSYYRHRRNSHRLGNLFEKHLRDIRFSKKHFELLKKIKNSECNVYNCRFHKYNNIMTELLINRNNELDFI